MLELVRTSAGTMLMGASASSNADEVIANFRKNFPPLGKALSKSPINLSSKSPKGATAAFLEHTRYSSNELMTPTRKRILMAGNMIAKSIVSGRNPRAKNVIAGAATLWLSVAGNWNGLISQNPTQLIALGKALVQEAKIALRASGA